MSVNEGTKSDGSYAEEDRRALFRYVALTIVLFVPLLLTFISIRDLYPFAASRMMIWNGDRQRGRSYYMLRGETVSGETIDLPPIKLTNALTGRSWSLFEGRGRKPEFQNPLASPCQSPHGRRLWWSRQAATGGATGGFAESLGSDLQLAFVSLVQPETEVDPA